MNKLILCMLAVCCLLSACARSQSEETVPSTTAPITVAPLPSTIDMTQLNNCTIAVSLKEGDAYVDDTGAMQMKVMVYDYDLYAKADIAQLQAGDTIILRGENVTVTSVERSDSGAVLINGGLDVGGFELHTDDSTVYYEIGYSDVKSWYAIGEATIRVSPDFLYTDSSDPDGGDITYYPGDFLIDGTGIDYNFTPYNTTIVIENDRVLRMYRVYTP